MRSGFRRVVPALLTLVLTAGMYAQQTAQSLITGIKADAVRAEFVGTGGSSGDSVKVRVSKGPKAAPGPHTYSVPPGSHLASSEASAQSMTIQGVAGREVSEVSYEPASVITVPERGSATYILA